MTADRQQKPELKAPPLLGSTRLNLAIVGFFGCVMVYALRSDVSFAIVCMVNETAVENLARMANISKSGHKLSSNCYVTTNLTEINGNQPKEIEGSLIWPKSVQGQVLSAFFWGYFGSQILGGYLASRIGGKIVIAFTVIASSILTLLSPVAAFTNVYLFFALRVALGLVQGAMFPAFHTMWSMWAPPLERSLLTGITYAGGQIGNTLVMPLSGILCKYGFAGGWPSIYYVLGIMGLIWSLVWCYFVADIPQKSRHISEEERAYIQLSLADIMSEGEDQKRKPVPWVEIMKSVPVWACYCGHFAGDWGAYMMMTSLPLFMNDILGFDLTSLGFLSAIPYIAYFVFINLGGLIADKIRDAGLLSTIAVRRSAMIIALGAQALFLIASGYCGCGQEVLVIVFLTLGIGLSGIQYAGFVVNYLDIAPTFAGPILGIGNTISCVAGILCPLMVGAMTPTGSKEEWQLVFWVTGAILLCGAGIFSVFASDQVQPWALAGGSSSREMVSLKLSKSDKIPLTDSNGTPSA